MDYSYLMQKALNFMETKLTASFCLEDVADIANFSMYHFHRLFVLTVGYTPKDYVRRRRLSEAARELTYNFRSIEEIAGRYQFESQASFTRAFGKQFGISPGKLRRSKKAFPYFIPVNFKEQMKRKGEETMEVKIVKKDAMKIVGMSVMSTIKENTIPQLWQDFNQKACKIGNVLTKGVAVGVCPPVDTKNFDDNTPFKYIAGLIVENFDDVPEGMESYEIPAQKYAVITHKGALDTLQKTYIYFYNTWVKESNYEFTFGAEFELYDSRFKFGEPDSEMDIYRPIK